MKVFTGVRGKNLSHVPIDVQLAERLGFDGIFFSEMTMDPFLASTLGAEHSNHLLLGTSIALAFPRSPMTTAYMSWNLQVLSQGRFQLGLGSQVRGHNIRRFSVNWTPPGPRMREYILSLRAIWECWQTGNPLNFKGENYSFNLMPPEFSPGPISFTEPSIAISAVNPYMCRLAGELCDGVLLHGFSTRKYTKEVILPNLESGAAKSGRKLGDIRINGGGFIIIGQTNQEVEQGIEETRRRISFYGSTQVYRPVLDIHGWGNVGDQLREMSLNGRWGEMPKLITDEMVEAFSIIGTYKTIGSKLTQYYGSFANQISLPLPESQLATQETEITELLQELQH
ncbi:TIGR03617 family F420-dependent LLM class oxidoreductase [SAR202 cluster bacterium AD-802-E10_MRT_200m]|nr:TIGR03617 family F420-dependent LLM class oxidoreductase [SAR202 cluster bacterium AD-802-E10_MRT_200m]